MKLIRWILPLAYVFAFQPFVHADVKDSFEPVQATLVAEDESIQAGHPFWVGVELSVYLYPARQ